MDLSLLVVSYNTKDLLERCLNSALEEMLGLHAELIVVDNASKDGSAEMVAAKFPQVILVKSSKNLGFAAANNRAAQEASGRYLVLLNSDAFMHKGSLRIALQHMRENPKIGLGGARLVSQDGSWQPSARLYPSVLNDFLFLSGLADKYANSKFLGRSDRAWAPPEESVDTDWVPGAFAIVPRELWNRLGGFDERFFLYYEEVDLCRRIKQEGYTIRYFGDVVVTHLGGESSKKISGELLSKGSQLILWRMRSALLYYRKHHGLVGAYSAKALQNGWHTLRILKNRSSSEHAEKVQESKLMITTMDKAWQDTQGGTESPPRPW